MITENISTLKIHKLTQAQYDRELEAGNIDENALYLTPDEAIDLSLYAEKGDVILVPSTAAVGQTITVKAVDENGKPTEWEAVDMPSVIYFYHGYFGDANTNATYELFDAAFDRGYENTPIDITELYEGTYYKGRVSFITKSTGAYNVFYYISGSQSDMGTTLKRMFRVKEDGTCSWEEVEA